MSSTMEQAWSLRDSDRPAARRLSEAVIADPAAEPRAGALARVVLSYLDYRTRRYAGATSAALEALAVLEADPADRWLPRLYNTLAIIHFDLGERGACRAYLERQIQLSAELGDRTYEAIGYHDLGLLQAEVDAGRGLATLAHAHGMFQGAGDAEHEALTLYNMANICKHAGDEERAASHMARALQILRSTEMRGVGRYLTVYLSTSLAEDALAQRRLDEARAHLDEAQALAEAQMPELLAHVYYCQGLHLTALGDHEGARAQLERALAQSGEATPHDLLADCYTALAGCAERRGDYRAALGHARAYSALRERIFAETGEQKVRALEVIHQVGAARREAEAERRRNAELQRYVEDLARARDAAEAAARARSAFLASMSHELRTPLNAVIGTAELLQETELTPEQRRLSATISTGAQALLAVVGDILDFSRIESGHIELDRAPFDLHACLCTTVDLVSHGARQKGLALTCTLDPHLPRAVVGDMGRLRQVLLNLLSNAVKFTDRGAVALEARATFPRPDLPAVALTVRDTGIGLTEAQIGRIFEPFVQAELTTARRYGGTGLGLAISRQLVAAMGGSIDVVSAPGAGSAFTVCVPLPLAPAAAVPPPAAPAAPRQGRLQVLVAEDNPVNQEVARLMLERLGHSVALVADGQAAVEAVARRPYDVVLMDVQMPVLDGEAAARRIRQLGPGVPQPAIIALTASALDGDRERFLRAGMDDYLRKPVQLAALRHVLGRLTAGAGAAASGAGRPGPPEPAPLVDWAQVAQFGRSLDLAGPEALAMVLRLFEQELPPQLAALAAASGAGDLPRLRRGAHQLRSGCLQLGLAALAELGRLLEHDAGPSQHGDLVARIHECYRRTGAALRRGAPAGDGGPRG